MEIIKINKKAQAQAIEVDEDYQRLREKVQNLKKERERNERGR